MYSYALLHGGSDLITKIVFTPFCCLSLLLHMSFMLPCLNFHWFLYIRMLSHMTHQFAHFCLLFFLPSLPGLFHPTQGGCVPMLNCWARPSFIFTALRWICVGASSAQDSGLGPALLEQGILPAHAQWPSPAYVFITALQCHCACASVVALFTYDHSLHGRSDVSD